MGLSSSQKFLLLNLLRKLKNVLQEGLDSTVDTVIEVDIEWILKLLHAAVPLKAQRCI